MMLFSSPHYGWVVYIMCHIHMYLDSWNDNDNNDDDGTDDEYSDENNIHLVIIMKAYYLHVCILGRKSSKTPLPTQEFYSGFSMIKARLSFYLSDRFPI